jgi:lipooligosaccharide transport system permease protein
VLAGEVLWALTRALIYGGSFLVIVTAFGLASPSGAAACVPVVILTGLLFASIGIAFSSYIQVIDYFSFYFTLFLTPLFLFSDVFFPLEERLTPMWQWVAEALPLLHPVRLARAAVMGQAKLHLVAWDIAYVLGLSGILLLAARRALARRLLS